ncbi:hypothetical protein CDIK_3965, partial [Cucumispora dikerogammari]
PERKKNNNEAIHVELRSIMGEDNSLTLAGCKAKISSNFSIPQLSRHFKAVGLTRKRLKKRPKLVLTDTNLTQRQTFCATVLGKMTRKILFIDESGFNFHTSINYGYSMVSEDAILYQPASKGQNISLCGIISSNGVENNKLIYGAYNRDEFMRFFVVCSEKGIFNQNPILVMDNVRFPHCEEILFFLTSINVEVLFLSAYSPDLNSIENVFSTIKSKLNTIMPRANTRDQLKSNINIVIESLSGFREYYRSFWERVNVVNNRLI